jgi:gamma-glutamyltranspeptidase/glutathione hydrolase
VHVEGSLVDAEPGVDPEALAALEQRGWELRQWEERNLYFGGVQAVARDADRRVTGGGDPRRGGIAIAVD